MKQDLRKRTLGLLEFDGNWRTKRKRLICGVDEAGRGPLAGPVVAAAVIFSDDVYIEGVFDSKQLTAAERENLYGKIVESALGYGVGMANNRQIDEMNILSATKHAMSSAILRLRTKPQLIIADGNFYENEDTKVVNIINGDEKSFSIAAASVIAKVTRDRMMSEYEGAYPGFSFSKHKGYATEMHIEEIEMYGFTDIHRRTFRVRKLTADWL